MFCCFDLLAQRIVSVRFVAFSGVQDKDGVLESHSSYPPMDWAGQRVADQVRTTVRLRKHTWCLAFLVWSTWKLSCPGPALGEIGGLGFVSFLVYQKGTSELTHRSRFDEGLGWSRVIHQVAARWKGTSGRNVSKFMRMFLHPDCRTSPHMFVSGEVAC